MENDLEIILGKNAGFCYGVKRAVEGAKEKLAENQNLYCLGEIVHNKEVTKSLEMQGLTFINDIKDSQGDTLIRAHGVPQDIYKYAKENNIKLYDFTCPRVLKIHNIAEEYRDKGYFIILLGNKMHPENIGTISYCGLNSCIVDNLEELNEILINIKKFKKVLVIAQTTFSIKKYDIIKKYIEDNIDKETSVVFKNTICKATEVRQKETFEMSKVVDFMIIVGGNHSSNTKKLYEIARENTRTVCIETIHDLDLTDLEGIKRIGIMAGASTPNESILRIIEKIRSYNQEEHKILKKKMF